MITQEAAFTALLDAGVSDSVRSVLRQRGHTVILHREILPEQTPDFVVAATALANDAILVAVDGDMRRIVRRYGVRAGGTKLDRLSLLHLCCKETQAAKRLDHAMTLVEHEWTISREKHARRMWVEIAEHHIRTFR